MIKGPKNIEGKKKKAFADFTVKVRIDNIEKKFKYYNLVINHLYLFIYY